MRKMNNDFDAAPTLLLDCAEKNENDLLEKREIKSNCYKKSSAKLEEQFAGKCAYCEMKYLATSDTWVEHYRPKSEYYWLAYEWSNLLPACTKCNRHKNNNFPLINEANKVENPPLSDGKLDSSKCRADSKSLIDEVPFVLHPKIDNPNECFDFKIDENLTGVEIVGVDNVTHYKYKGRGEATIEICNLNRYELKIDRYKTVILEIINAFYYVFKILQFSKISLSKYDEALGLIFDQIIQNADKPDLEHTLLRKIITDENKFETIICQAIDNDNMKKIIGEGYKKYKNKKK